MNFCSEKKASAECPQDFPKVHGSPVSAHPLRVSDLRTIKRGNDGNEQCPEPLVMVKHRGIPKLLVLEGGYINMHVHKYVYDI
jgi:hypothetical protein